MDGWRLEAYRERLFPHKLQSALLVILGALKLTRENSFPISFWLEGWMDGWMNAWLDGWLDGWLVVWMDGWMDGWLDGWMERGERREEKKLYTKMLGVRKLPINQLCWPNVNIVI